MVLLLFTIPILYFEIVRYFSCKPDGCGLWDNLFLSIPVVFFLILGITIQFFGTKDGNPPDWVTKPLTTLPFLFFVAGMIAVVCSILF